MSRGVTLTPASVVEEVAKSDDQGAPESTALNHGVYVPERLRTLLRFLYVNKGRLELF